MRSAAKLKHVGRLVQRLRGPKSERQRGDVPGWVLITVMTAALVTAVWMVAEARLPGLFNNAVDSVHGTQN